MKHCKRCGHAKTWSGSDITCPFQDGDVFTEDNWNCGHIGKIRELCDVAMDDDDCRLHYQYCDDQQYVVIKTDDIDFEDGHHLCLWVSWYKRRGATDAMWLLSEKGAPVTPTYDDIDRIIKHYNVSQ